MKNSKMLFAIIAAVLLLGCLLAYLLLRPSGGNSPHGTATDPSQASPLDQTDYELIEPDPGVTVTLPPSIAPEIIVSDDVTIRKIPKDPNEVIDREPLADPSHPEYIGGISGDYYFSEEGKVYRNDKTISIRVRDTRNDTTHDITFGYITGGCNRFLYLNPTVETDGKSIPCNFYFQTPIGGGAVLTLSDALTSYIYDGSQTYTLYRALEEKKLATYTAPNKPGTCWFCQTAKDGPFYINTLVVSMEGDYIASLRLTIAKEDDGTYVLADLDNNNLLQNSSASKISFSKEELLYIEQLANETLNDSSQTLVAINPQQEDRPYYTLDEMIMEIRDETTGLYFSEFVPTQGVYRNTDFYTDMLIPILAVAVRGVSGEMAFTLYYQIYTPPSNGKHGYYNFIGRDFHDYKTIEVLKAFGYGRIKN